MPVTNLESSSSDVDDVGHCDGVLFSFDVVWLRRMCYSSLDYQGADRKEVAERLEVDL